MRGPLRPQTPTPAAVTPTAPTPVTPTPPVAQPAAPTPTPAAPAPAVMENTLASSAAGSVLNKPVATVAPTPAPRKEGLIEGIPASQWIAQESTGYNSKVQAMNPTTAAASGQVYNQTTGQMVPRGYNPYTGNVPSAQRQTAQAPAPAVISAPKPPAPEQPIVLDPEQQKTLDRYNRSAAGQFQNMPRNQLRAGVASDVFSRR